MAKFILSKNKVLEKFKEINIISDIVSYSSKTNPLVTKILEENTSCLFSVHLKNELKNIKDKKRIIYLAQALDEHILKELSEQEINKFVIDNESDLDILTKFLEKNSFEVELMLRVKLKEFTIKTEKYFVFGMSSELVSKKIKELKGKKEIKKIGIHFHRKTQNISEWNYKYELENMFDEEIFSMIDFINIGGGIPGVYANTNTNVIESIKEKIKELKKWLNQKNIEMIIEPGRFIAAPSVKLVTKIIGMYEKNIIVDASVYNSDMDALIVPVKLLIEDELLKNEGYPYVIKGITPCSLDLFRYKVYLKNPKVGENLTFLNAGAYDFSTDFCNLEKIKTEVVD